MDLSIVILNYKQAGLIKYCLRGIKNANLSLKYEIIVVDNNSGDNCLKMVNDFYPDVVTVAAPKNSGFAAGNNLGIQRSRGRYVLILNPDVVIIRGKIEKMMEFADKNLKAGIIGPKLINADGSLQYSCRRFFKWRVPIYRRTFIGRYNFAKRDLDDYLMRCWDHNHDAKVEWLFGACLLIRRELIDKIGFLDERFFMYFEDADYCRRCWESGMEVWYLASVELIHYHHQQSAEKVGLMSLLNKATLIHVNSAIKYFIKYFKKKTPLDVFK